MLCGTGDEGPVLALSSRTGPIRKGSKESEMTRSPRHQRPPAICAKKSYRVVFERRSNPLGGRSNRLSSSFEAASERRRSDACRPLHYDKPGSFKMVHKSGGDDLGHDLVRVVDALAALISQCEGEGGGKVGRVGRREGFGRLEHATG